MPDKFTVTLLDVLFVHFDKHTKKLRDQLGLQFKRRKSYEEGYLQPFSIQVQPSELLQLVIDLNEIDSDCSLILIEAVDKDTVHLHILNR